MHTGCSWIEYSSFFGGFYKIFEIYFLVIISSSNTCNEVYFNMFHSESIFISIVHSCTLFMCQYICVYMST